MAIAVALTAIPAAVGAQVPGPNVNMVSGTTLPAGDPFLQRQNEPSGAVSTRNPLHILGGANDYRTVDLPGLPDGEENGDAWLGVFKSFDGGQTWQSTLIPGYPQDKSTPPSPLKGFAAGADPMVRAGTNGLFYFSGLAFNRGTGGLSSAFVSRFIDNNNVPGGDPIAYLSTSVVASGTSKKFIDKPFIAVDIPRPIRSDEHRSGPDVFPMCTIPAQGKIPVQGIPAGAVYLGYVVFEGTEPNLYSTVMLQRSLDCGVTWSKPVKVSEGKHARQGTAIAIDPNSGAVYVAWRQFADVPVAHHHDDDDDDNPARRPKHDNDQSGDAIFIAKSIDLDKKLSEPMEFTEQKVAARLKPFDQGLTPTTFRTNSYPTIAVDGSSRVYLAWSERGWGPASPSTDPSTVPNGDARIVMMTASPAPVRWRSDGERRSGGEDRRRDTDDNDERLGIKWTDRRPIENVATPGHQIMPAMTLTAGKLSVIYYDLREDKSQVFRKFVDDLNVSTARHTIDVRVVQADPGDVPQFAPSVRVSQYLMGSRPGPKGAKPIEQLQFNVPNLPLYKQGTAPFIGDYIDLASVPFVQDAIGKWVHNLSPDGPGVLYAFWTDNRDVRPPVAPLTWKDYTPPTNPFSAVACTPGTNGMRNSNTYAARISPGLVVGAPTNSKRLQPAGLKPGNERSFVVFAQNNIVDPVDPRRPRRYRFTIANQPPGGQASFLQFSPVGNPLTSVDATIPPRSTASRTVYVTSTDPKASVKVDVVEVEVPTTPTAVPPVKIGGLQSAIVLNPDVTNPDVTNPDVTNSEVFNPDVTNPDVTNPDVTNPDVTNPDVTNPDVTNVRVANPDVTNPDVTNPDVTNPDVTNPDVTNPDVTNPDVTNGSIADVTWTVRNNGNTAGSFAIKPFLTKNAPAGFKKQLLLHKTYVTPVSTDCTVKTTTQTVLLANIPNPDVTNPDVTNPDVTNPDVTNPDVTNATLWLGPGESARITLRVVNPDTSINPVVTKTVTLSNGTQQNVVLPAAIDLSTQTSAAVAPQAVDSAAAAQGVTTPPVVAALVITTTSLPDGVTSAPYAAALSAVGGATDPGTFRTWSIVPGTGTLPPGLAMNSATGTISGVPAAAGSFPFTVQVADSAVPPHVNAQDLFIRIAPAALPQTVSPTEDTALPITLTATGANNASLAFAVTVSPTHGTLSGTAPNLTYTPAADYFGPDSFAFTATLPTGLGALTSPPATVSLTVTDVNDAPVPGADTKTAVEDQNLVFPSADLAANDRPGPANEGDLPGVAVTVSATQENQTLTVIAVSSPSANGGTVSLINGQITYRAAANYNGTDTFTYTVQDNGTTNGAPAPKSAVGTVTVTVLSVNDPPIGTNGAVTTNEDTAYTFAAANFGFTDPNDTPANALAAVKITTLPVAGTLKNNGLPVTAGQEILAADLAANRLTFSAAPNANGSPYAAFTFQVRDDGGTTNGGIDLDPTPKTMAVTVLSVNDPPVGTNGAVTTEEDTAYTFTASDFGFTDPNDAPPNALAGVTITTLPTAGALTLGAVAVTPGQEISAADLAAGNLTFNPALNANGSPYTAFTFQVRDDGGIANGGIDLDPTARTLAITVIPVADTPSVTNATTLEDTQTTSGLVISRNAADGAEVTHFKITNITGGSLFLNGGTTAVPNGTFLTFAQGNAGLKFTPAANSFATGHITVQAAVSNDDAGLGGNAVTADIAVTAVNDAPVGTTGTVVTNEDTDYTFAAANFGFMDPNDSPANALAGVKITTLPTAGALKLSGGAVTTGQEIAAGNLGQLMFSSAPNANGVAYATFTFQVRDDGGTANGGVDLDPTPRTMTINVTPVNDAPVATGQNVSTAEDTPVAITLTASDVDGNALTYSVTSPAHGTLSAVTGASVTYTPAANYYGLDSFTFKANDGTVDSNAATVVITVTPVNDAPVANNDTAFTSTNTPIDIDVTANDTDVDNGTGGTVLASFAPMPTSAGATTEMAVEPVSGRLYAATGFQKVVVLDPTTPPPAMTVVGTIATPVSLSGQAHRVNPATGLMYFRNAGGNIEVINPATNQLVASLATNGINGRATMAVDDGNVVRAPRLYVLQGSRILVFDADPLSSTSHQVVNAIDLGSLSANTIAFDRTLNRLYLAHSTGLIAYDVATDTPTSLPGAPVPSTEIVTGSHYVFVAGTTGAGVTTAAVYNATTNALIAGSLPVQGSVTLGSFNKHFALNQTTGTAYLRTSDPTGVSGWVTAITGAGVTTPIVVGRDSFGNVDIVVDETLNKVVTIAERDLRVAIIDGSTKSVVANVHLPNGSTNGDIELDAARHIAYVSDGEVIQKIDLTTNIGTPLAATAFVDGGAVNPQTHQFYVETTFGTTAVSIFDQTGPAGTVTGLPHSDGRLLTMASDRFTNTFYAANLSADLASTNDGTPAFVSAIDGATGQVTGSLPAGNNPAAIAVNSATHRVYVGDQSGATTVGGITEVTFPGTSTALNLGSLQNATDGSVLSVGRGMVVNEATNRLYFQILGGSTATAGVYDVAGATATRLPLAGTWGTVRAIGVNPTPAVNRIYLGTQAFGATPGQLHVLDGNTHAELATLNIYSPNGLTGVQQNIAVDTTHGLVYVGDALAGTVSVVDSSNAVIATLNVCSSPAGIALNTTANRAYVACPAENGVAFIDGGPGPNYAFHVVGHLPVPYTPVFVYADDAASLVYTTSSAVPNPGVVVIRDAAGALDGLLAPTSVQTPTPHNGTATVNGDGTVRYSPANNFAGTDTFTYVASDGQAQSAPATVSITVSPGLTITSVSPLPQASVGQQYAFQFAAAGGTGTLTWTFLGQQGQQLPNGMSLSSSGLLTGRATNGGPVTFTVQVADQSNPPRGRSGVFSMTITSLSMTTASLPGTFTGAPYSQTLTATGGVQPYSWSIASGSLPAGLTITSAGVISGAATTTGTSFFTVRVTDSASTPQASTLPFSLAVSQPITITTTSLNIGVMLQNYSSPVNANGGSGARTWSITGALPLGESFAASDNTSSSFGSWAGGQAQPKSNGDFPVTVTVSDSSGSDSKGYNLRVFAVDQHPFTGSASAVTVAGAARAAQTVTVGATGLLTGVRFSTLTCSALAASNPLTVKIEGVNAATGAPDDTQVLATVSNVTINNSGQIVTLPSPLFFAADARFAIVVSSTGTCSIPGGTTSDNYPMGSAYIDTGAGWATSGTLFDMPLDTLMQNTALLSMGTSSKQIGAAKAVTLASGKVLVVGNQGNAQVLDPATAGTAAPVAPVAMVASSRSDATVTLLANGKVLVTGGNDNSSTAQATAEIFDPAGNSGAGTFSSVGPMSQGRNGHAAVLLVNGKVLITGGQNESGTLATAELFDPSGSSFTTISNMVTSRTAHSATLLADGRVLLAGGFSNGAGPSAEVYDPGTGTFTATTGGLLTWRGYHTATLLAGGTVLIAGGSTAATGNNVIINTGEIFTPSTGRFSSAGTMIAARQRHAATLLTADGSVLLTGGQRTPTFGSAPWASAERYVPGTGFVAAAPIIVTRSDHGAEPISGGRVLIAGGSSGNNGSAQAGSAFEIYNPDTSLSGTPTIANPNLPDASINVPYGATLNGTGGTGPYIFANVAPATLPPGLSLTAAGVISGTPTAAGTFYPEVRITDANAHSSVQALRLGVSALSITTTSLPPANQNQAYGATLTATGVGAKTWTVISGSLPVGLNLNASGSISGTVTSGAGTTSFFTVKAADSVFQVATQNLSIQVNNGLTITTISLGEAAVLENSGVCLNTNNAVGNSTFSVSGGSLPAGMSLQAGGCFAGAPLRDGSFSVTVQASDQATPPQIASRSYTGHVSARDQQGYSSPGTSISFGGPGGRQLAQTFISGANGTLTAFGLTSLSCPPSTQVTVQIQGVLTDGTPDGHAIATGTASGFFNAMPLSPTFPVTIGARFAAVLSSTTACDIADAPSTYDSYTPGDAYATVGTGWALLKDTDGRYDLPFRTLIQPAVALTYLTKSRSSHTTVPLNNGKVLVVGSDGTAELVDPSANTSTPTGSMSVARWSFTTTLLDNGSVLVTGGGYYDFASSTFTYLSSAELYNPSDGTFTPVGSMSAARQGHAATKLADGRVLISGGYSATGTLRSAEIYTVGGGFSPTGDMTVCRSSHTGTLLTLPSGKVLLAGGSACGASNSADVYDPATGTFAATAGGMVVPRAFGYTATALPNGKVLLAGGYVSSASSYSFTNSAEEYDPATNAFAATGNMGSARYGHAAELLADGSVLLAGGKDDPNAFDPLASLERYLPATRAFVSAGSMVTPRWFFAATRLQDNTVLLTGGSSTSWLAGNSAELYDEASTPALTTSPPDGQVNVLYPATMLVATGGSGAPYQITIASGSLPPGLSYDTGTFTLTGTPNVAGVFGFGVGVIDSFGHSVVQPLTIKVSSLVITTASLPNGAVGANYNYQLAATGVAPVNWTLWSGSLPVGFALSSAGVISGTPTAQGYGGSFTVRATDSLGQAAVRSFSIYIASPLTITTTSLDAGTATWGYGTCINTNGGSYPRTYSISSGALPAGLTLDQNNGCLNTVSGSLRASGTSTFTVTVADAAQTVSRTFTIRVGASDQSTGGFDQSQPTLSFGNGVKLAQVFRQSTAGDLIAVLAPVACTAQQGGTFTIDIMPVDGVGHIVNSVLLSQTFDVNQATPFNGYPYSRRFTFASSITVPLNIRLAAVFSSATGNCSWVEALPANAGQWTYGYGAGFKGTGAPTAWTPIALTDASRPNLPLYTLVDPNGTLDFMIDSGRGSHTATVLGNGTVLLAGGTGWGSSAEIYTPGTLPFASTSNPMSARRRFHTTTTLQGGSLLIVGGRDDNTLQPLITAEIYDPVGGTFTPTGNLGHARFYHTATLLNDGRVLITGGNTDFGISVSSTEIYDPTLHTFSPGPTMNAQRAEHTATLLTARPHSGDVLIVGGWGSPGDAERYTPGAPGTFTPTAVQPTAFHAMHTATQLLSGKVLFVGTWSNTGRTTAAETYDPASDSFTATGNLAVAAGHHAAALLADGRVLIAGGDTDSGDSSARLELFNPAGAGTFSSANTMTVPRASLTATTLPSGKVLLAGGYGQSSASWSSGELFDPTHVIVTIQNPSLPDGQRGQPYGPVQLAGAGGTSPYQFDIVSGTLPPNVSLSGSGSVSGTPPNDNSATGTYDFGVRITDSANVSGIQTLRLRIDPVDITTTGLPQGIVGTSYNATLTGTGVGLTWTLIANSGSLPAGLTLSAGGAITGTPTQVEVVSFTVKATDAVGQTATRLLNIGVIPTSPPQALNDAFNAIENVTLNQPAPGVLANDIAAGGTVLTAWLVTNTAHGNVTLNANGSFSYVPALDYIGTDSFTYQASDGFNNSNVATVSLTVNQLTINVPGPYGPTIQAAINAASRGSIVQVAAGTYNENLVWNNKSISLIGAGAWSTVVDGGHAASVLRITDVPATGYVGGFTFTNGASTADVFTDGRTWGGGVMALRSPLTIANNTITGSSANGGGGIALIYSNAVLRNNTIANNSAVNEGGGLDSQGSSPLLLNNVITANSHGGVMSFVGNSTAGPTIVNSLVAGNFGGGVSIWRSALTLINTTVTGNTSFGVAENEPSQNSVTITNSILFGNPDGLNLTGWNGGSVISGAAVTYSTVGVGNYTPGTAVSTADPLFVNPGGGDYHLPSYSPAINAGSNAAIVGYTTDLEDNPRIVDTTVDQGAYENQTGAPATVLGPAGGGGGSPFQLMCPGGTFGTALLGRSGDDIDRTELLCETQSAGAVGDSGGTDYGNLLTCPAGSLLTGVYGRAGTVNWGGDVVDQLGVKCTNQSTGATVSSALTGNLSSNYGNPPFFALDCPVGKKVVGIFGGQGGLLDRIGVICQ